MKKYAFVAILTAFMITSKLWSGTVCAAPLIFTEPNTGMKFVGVPSGCLRINSADKNDKKIVEACVSSFFIGAYTVTQGEWKRIMGNNPSAFSSCGDDCPVEKISWHDIQEYVIRLNAQSKVKYRLPTEIEWEYACRSGKSNEKFCGGDDINELAWYKGNSDNKTHRVGQKKPNDWGIYDMTGNVWQWVQDWYDSSYPGTAHNPTGPETGYLRVFRGGGYRSEPETMRVESRFRDSPNHSNRSIGFRLVFSVQETTR